MTDAELLAFAIEMRAAKRAYHRATSGSDEKQCYLHRSMELERRFDRAVAGREKPSPQLRLF